ncbi:hypothetical protein [Priestia koreensis]|uniref:hypothetical protein n=1 Tax=Priestia koreensis TaxID=284581 RepID=UPI001F56ED48|nr:hypothetical protein [Priestia koreensis]UNL87595.1 hypothetical protein IE339_24150 [Priestia koreensis]
MEIIRSSKEKFIPLDMFQSSDKVLQPCICYHCYEELSDKEISTKIISAKGNCFRNEIVNELNNFRKSEFEMREIVIFGDSHEVSNLRKNLMSDVWNLFCKLGLNGLVQTANDPFFYYEDFKKETYQLMSEAKYELIYTPKETDSKGVAIASFNYIGEYLCRKYNIKKGNKIANSACIAFGIDRWSEAIINRYGNTKNNWPQLLKNEWSYNE